MSEKGPYRPPAGAPRPGIEFVSDHERARFFEDRYDDMRQRVEDSLDLLDNFGPIDAYDVGEVRGLIADLRQTLESQGHVQ